MRIPQVAALIVILFIAYGGCRPNREYDYQNNQEDYDSGEDNIPEPTIRDELDGNSPSSHILSHPLKLLVRLGDSVHLPCNVSNPQDIVVTWKKGAKLLYFGHLPDNIDSNRIVRLNNNSLIIHNFNNDDISDEYVCEISSTPPEDIVHSVRISRHVFVLPSQRVEVNEANVTIRLACQTNWEPKRKIKWSHQGTGVASDSFPEDGSFLTIHNVTEKSAGLYQCLVETGKGSDPMVYPIDVVVQHAPKIYLENEIVYTGIHMDAELSCRVDAFPQAEVRWFKNGNVITARNRIVSPNQKGNSYILAISRVEKSDFGKYSCEARNAKGQASRIIELTGAPRESKFIGVNVSGDGTVPILEWEVQSDSPILNYELEYRLKGDQNWQIAKPRVSDDGTTNVFRVKYPLEGLKAGSYEAVLIAQNEFGWSPRPSKSITFVGANLTPEPEIAGSKSGAASTQSLLLLRSLLLVASLLVCTTYL